MYSKIPMPHFEWTKDNMKYSMCFFPLIGAVIGGVFIGMYYLLEAAGLGGAIEGALLMMVPIIISGGIHVDGLLDTADALSSHQPVEKKLEILKDSNAGAFAIIVGACYFITDFAFKTNLSWRSVLIVACGFMVSRGLSGFAVVTFKCAKGSGLLHTFSDSAQRTAVRVTSLIYVCLGVALMLLANVYIGALSACGALLVFLYYRLMSYRQFGGINGDQAGFFLQLCELAVLIAAVLGDRIWFW